MVRVVSSSSSGRGDQAERRPHRPPLQLTEREAMTSPRLPPGQVLTQKWPVLTNGATPAVDLETWTFRCFGLVGQELTWTWKEFLELPRVAVTSDIHCVTRWSRFDNLWEGVSVSEILRRMRVRPEAVAVMAHSKYGYTTNIALEDLLNDDVLLAIKHDGRDLPAEHGGPCRLVIPKLYFWKSAKWIRAFELLDVNAPGFWEVNGYHLHADPGKKSVTLTRRPTPCSGCAPSRPRFGEGEAGHLARRGAPDSFRPRRRALRSSAMRSPSRCPSSRPWRGRQPGRSTSPSGARSVLNLAYSNLAREVWLEAGLDPHVPELHHRDAVQHEHGRRVRGRGPARASAPACAGDGRAAWRA